MVLANIRFRLDISMPVMVTNPGNRVWGVTITLSSIPLFISTDILDFFQSYFYTIFALSSRETSVMPRSESSSTVSQGYFVFVLPSMGHHLPRLGPLDPNK